MTIICWWHTKTVTILNSLSENEGIKLFDTQTLKEVFVYEKETVPISAVRWIPGVPGGFISADTKSGILKVWNVSQR